MKQLLYTVNEVFDSSKYLDVERMGYYNIPLYQRGYKWEKKHVVKLLDDVFKFKIDNEKFYCLQNITLVPNDGFFNVVDGQQRLTTLTLLLTFLGEKDLVKGKVQFPENSIRKETNRFLNQLVSDEEIDLEKVTWEELIKSNQDFDHQDIYHLFHSYKAISDWFTEKQALAGFNLESYKTKLLNHVKFILNVVDATVGEEKVFGNLNSKRIPLDGADLIRASIITRLPIEENQSIENVKQMLMVNERRVKIGWLIDQMSNWWSNSEVKDFYTKIVNVDSEQIGGNNLFDISRHPINLLYSLHAETKGESMLTLDFIENYSNKTIEYFKSVQKVHHVLVDWFNDRNIYHLLGYLFFQVPKNKVDFKNVWSEWNTCKTRTAFIQKLKGWVKESLHDSDNNLIDFENMDNNWYKKQPVQLLRALVLMDVIHATRKNQSKMPVLGFSKNNNDIEHIFPQTPKEQEHKKQYIEYLHKYVITKYEDKFDLKEFDSKIKEEEYVSVVDEYIQKHIEGIRINSIGNLVLLYRGLNRSFKNANYIQKRARVVEFYNKGKYIQPHTFHVFVRYFNNSSKENIDIEYWGNPDIEANAHAITKSIKQFLNA